MGIQEVKLEHMGEKSVIDSSDPVYFMIILVQNLTERRA